MLNPIISFSIFVSESLISVLVLLISVLKYAVFPELIKTLYDTPNSFSFSSFSKLIFPVSTKVIFEFLFNVL